MTTRMIKRMNKELRSLQTKITKLGAFIGTVTFHNMEAPAQLLLRKQYSAMLDYENYLGKRIDYYNNLR